jgi:hypothetical protein
MFVSYKTLCLLLFSLSFSKTTFSQNIIPFDTSHWEISAKSHSIQDYKGEQAIYIDNGLAKLKDFEFTNGAIEFDVFLTRERGFPGVRFRIKDNGNSESFYLRSHLSGKPDANQAIPVFNGVTPWQLYFGAPYSFAYDYNYSDWTHVRIVVNGQRAQIYLDHSEVPQLSWKLVHPPSVGSIAIGGSFAPMYYANFKLTLSDTAMVDFQPIIRKSIPNLIQEWQLSDMFEESELNDLDNLNKLINDRQWNESVGIDEGIAANISRKVRLYNGQPGNTVFAKITIHSDKKQTRIFEFGYSDRVVAILNGKPIYKGNNKWQSRDYRYLGTIGIFDAIYLDLEEGDNELLFAVSEDFGGWLITGRFDDNSDITIK